METKRRVRGIRFTCAMRVLSAQGLGGRYHGWSQRSSQALPAAAISLTPIELSFVAEFESNRWHNKGVMLVTLENRH